MNRERTFDLDSVIAEAERREARPADKSQIRDMAERMALERRERLRRARLLVQRPQAAIVEERVAYVHVVQVVAKTSTPAPVTRSPLKFTMPPKSKSLQVLLALYNQALPISLNGLHSLLPGIKKPRARGGAGRSGPERAIFSCTRLATRARSTSRPFTRPTDP